MVTESERNSENGMTLIDPSTACGRTVCIVDSGVPAWLGLKAPALAWPEVALAF